MPLDLEEIAIEITAGAHATPPRSSEMAWPSPSMFQATSSSWRALRTKKTLDLHAP